MEDDLLGLLNEIEQEEKELKAQSTEKQPRHKILRLIKEEVGRELSPNTTAVDKKHHEICVEVLKLHEEYKFPVGVILYLGINGCGAKTSTFEKKYKTFDKTRTERIIKWMAIFAKYNKNNTFRTNDRIAHAFYKFYTTVSPKTTDFKKAMDCWTPMPSNLYKSNYFATATYFYEYFYNAFKRCTE